MNIISKLCCTVGILSGVAGGITLGVGAAQGGKVQRIQKGDAKQLAYVVSEEEYNAYKLTTADTELDIEMVSGNINLIPSTDGSFAFNYIYRLNDRSVELPNEKNPFKIDETKNFFNWSQLDFLFNLDSELTISIPSWFDEKINVDLVNGNINSSVTSYKKDIEFNAVNGNISLSDLEETSNIKAKAVNGKITINASKFENPSSTLEYKLETVNGDATIAMNANAKYRYTFKSVNGDHNVVGASNEGMLISFETVNGDLVINN